MASDDLNIIDPTSDENVYELLTTTAILMSLKKPDEPPAHIDIDLRAKELREKIDKDTEHMFPERRRSPATHAFDLRSLGNMVWL